MRKHLDSSQQLSQVTVSVGTSNKLLRESKQILEKKQKKTKNKHDLIT